MSGLEVIPKVSVVQVMWQWAKFDDENGKPIDRIISERRWCELACLLSGSRVTVRGRNRDFMKAAVEVVYSRPIMPRF